jgi:hypothetical protein
MQLKLLKEKYAQPKVIANSKNTKTKTATAQGHALLKVAKADSRIKT